MHARSLSDYAREVRAALPAAAFAPARSRLWWLPVHAAIVVLAVAAIAAHAPLLVCALLSLVIGHSFACLTFLAHEILHGTVVRNRLARGVVGWVCFLPFTLSPRLWVAWHNRAHHGHTMIAGEDPDAYPTLDAYQRDRSSRLVADHFTLGRGHVLGFLSVFVGFSAHSTHMTLSARKYGFLSRRDHIASLAEKALGVLLWTALAFALGVVPFLFAYVLPMLVANALVLAFILTNHSLSPMTEVNDPLLNSLTVTVPRWMELTTLNFGYHVEHHVFPAMSPRHAPAVSKILRERWSDRYQSMPLLVALRRMLDTGRVYKDATTLCDPRSGREWPTLSRSDLVAWHDEQGLEREPEGPFGVKQLRAR
jgi:fatty acid desaturase